MRSPPQTHVHVLPRHAGELQGRRTLRSHRLHSADMHLSRGNSGHTSSAHKVLLLLLLLLLLLRFLLQLPGYRNHPLSSDSHLSRLMKPEAEVLVLLLKLEIWGRCRRGRYLSVCTWRTYQHARPRLSPDPAPNRRIQQTVATVRRRPYLKLRAVIRVGAEQVPRQASQHRCVSKPQLRFLMCSRLRGSRPHCRRRRRRCHRSRRVQRDSRRLLLLMPSSRTSLGLEFSPFQREVPARSGAHLKVGWNKVAPSTTTTFTTAAAPVTQRGSV